MAFNSHLILTAGQLEILQLLHVQAFKGKPLSFPLSFFLSLSLPFQSHPSILTPFFYYSECQRAPPLPPPVSMPLCNRLVSITKGGLDICWWMSMAAGSLTDSAARMCARALSAG